MSQSRGYSLRRVFRIVTATGFKSDAKAFAPILIASKGIAPPPEKGSTHEWSAATCAIQRFVGTQCQVIADFKVKLIGATLPSGEIRDEFKKSIPQLLIVIEFGWVLLNLA